jgi:acetylornithine deacetylase
MPIDPIQLAKQLVDIESTTYHEAPAGEFLAAYLAEQGYLIERQPVPQPDPARNPSAGTGPRFNVYASLPGITPDIVFSSHMDTVPPFLGPCREDANFLYGRGTCDAKGIIATQIAAAEKLQAAGKRVALLYVVGEERDSAGAIVANDSPKGSRFIINNRLALASKGCLRVELRAHGKMAHSAYPELGDSAINKLLAALHDIQALPLPIVEGIGDTTLNIGVIKGGVAPNVIPDKAEAHLLIRLVGPPEDLMDAIVRAANGRCDVNFTLKLPYLHMRAIPGFETMVAKFTTDIPSLTNWGEPFLLGPGSILVAHTPDEKIRKSELLECVDLYVKLATSLLA